MRGERDARARTYVNASACIAVFEQSVWVLLGLALVAIVLLVLGANLVRRFGQ